MSWQEVTAIFGGTFDPPHLGHRLAVEGLFQRPGVKSVVILPAANPPHKPFFASPEARVAMTRECFSGSLGGEVRIDLRELDRAKAQPERRSYTFDTLQELRRELPQLAFVIGVDQLEQLPGWHRFPEVLSLSHWIVLARKPDGAARAAPALRQLQASGLLRSDGRTEARWRITAGDRMLELCETPAPEVSSTAIREAIGRTGFPPESLLPPGVVRYLKEHGVYGSNRK